MSTKIEPCKAENRRHTWEHVKNKTVRRETLRSIELSLKWVYRCVTCGTWKYGSPQGDKN